MNGADVLVLVDSDSTHNIVDINVAHSISLQEQHIDTTILVGSGNAMPCRGASFNVPLRISSDAFDIDTFLLNIVNDVDVVLGTPWLASLGRVTWDFTDMEMLYFHDGRPHTFHVAHHRQVPTPVWALTAPPPMVCASDPSPPPHPEILYFHDGRPHTFHVAHHRQVPTPVRALPAPPPVVCTSDPSPPPHPPRHPMNMS
jgi:hypothetical protein